MAEPETGHTDEGAKGEQDTLEISVGDGEPVLIPWLDFAARSGKFAALLGQSGLPQGSLSLGAGLHRDSVVQFLGACQGKPLELTPDNVFEVDLLCEEWDTDRSIRERVRSYIVDHLDDLLLPQIIFKAARALPCDKQEVILRSHFLDFIDNPRLVALPIGVLERVVDFGAYAGDPTALTNVFGFCLRYLDAHPSEGSALFKTAPVGRLAVDDLHALCSRPHFDRTCLNDSTGRAIALLQEKVGGVLTHVARPIDTRLQDLEELVRAMSRQIAELQQEIATLQDDVARPYSLEAPDWPNRTGKTWNTAVTADAQGWIYAHCCSYSNNKGYLTVNARQYDFCNSDNGSYYWYASTCIPIRSGDKYQATGGSSSQQLYFIPCRPRVIIRPPDWDRKLTMPWNVNHTAEENGWVYAESASQGNTAAYLTLNSQQFIVAQSTQNALFFTSVCMPVVKGDTYQGTGGFQYQQICFIPQRTSSHIEPPNWGQAASKQWDRNHTAEKSGWIHCWCCSSHNTNTGYLTVNSHRFLVCRDESGFSQWSSVCVPVSRGDTYYATGGSQGQQLSFVPPLE